MNQIAIINSQQRFFAKKRKSKRSASSDEGATTDGDAAEEEDPRLAAVASEPEPTPEPVTPAFSAPFLPQYSMKCQETCSNHSTWMT